MDRVKDRKNQVPDPPSASLGSDVLFGSVEDITAREQLVRFVPLADFYPLFDAQRERTAYHLR